MEAMMSSMVPRLVLFALLCTSACKFPVPPDVDDGDAATCTPSTTTCTGSTLTVCDAAGHPTTSTCSFGCFTSGDRCADLAPSNGLAQYLDQARTAPPLLLSSAAQLNTDTALLDNGAVPIITAVVRNAPVDILVVIVRSMEAQDVAVSGSRALAIVADGDVMLHGRLTLDSGQSFVDGVRFPGPGAHPPNDPACTASRGTFDTTGYAGAGGGGHGTPGGRGGSGNGLAGGSRGEAVGSEALQPLRGGCGGAIPWGTQGDLANPQAGEGGGAIQISTRGVVLIDGTGAITANGSGGGGVLRSSCPFVTGDPPGCNAGAGGGAGGAILLEAATVEIAGAAVLAANGGGGTCSFRGGGAAGDASESPAPGQDCSSTAEAGSGGRGGAGALSATDGGGGTVTGGGGGGGAGRIRINLPAGVTFDPGPPIVSPTPSLGVAGVR